MIAVMTNDHALAAVISQRHVAVRTLNCFAARATKNETRITAPVEQDDRLLTALARFANRFEQLIGKHARFAVARKDRCACRRFWRSPSAAQLMRSGNVTKLILAFARVVKRFERRCRGTKYDRGRFFLRAHDRDVTRVVVRRLLLPVGRSCSSSTTIKPRFLTGANTAERVPITTRASPFFTRVHSSNRSPF